MVDHARIEQLAKKRMPPAVIAKVVGCSRDKVYASIRRARTNGADIPHFTKLRATESEQAATTTSIAVPIRLMTLLRAEAERQGRTINEVARNCIERSLLGKVSDHVR